MNALTVKAVLACLIATACASAGTVYVQPIQICDDNDLNCANPNFTLYEAETNKIWAQAGVSVSFDQFLYADSTYYLNLFVDQQPTLDTFMQNLQLPAYDPLHIYMFFIHSLTDTTNGGTFFGVTSQLGGNFIWITDEIYPPTYPAPGRIDTIAHELGHALGIEHSDTGSNTCTGFENRLMASGNCRSIPTDISGITTNGITGLDLLSAQDITTAQASTYNTPEPGTIILAASSFGLIWVIRRRSTAA